MAGAGHVPDEPLTAVRGRTAGGFLGLDSTSAKTIRDSSWDFLCIDDRVGLDQGKV